MKPSTLTRWGRWLHWSFPLLARPFRRRAITQLSRYRLTPAVIPHLITALGSSDRRVAALANASLRDLTQSAASVKTLIDHVLANAGQETLVPLINECGYRHPDEGRWLLYLVLAGRFDDYLKEDFEFQRLRPEFQAVKPDLQARIRERIVQAGDTRMNALFVTEHREKVLGDLSDADADVLVKVNVRHQNWEQLFRYLWVLPARQIAAAVRAMRQGGWQPDDPDHAALYGKLAALVAKASDAPGQTGLALDANPVFQEWFARGRTGEFAAKPDAELPALVKKDVNPADQIAALAGLQRRGKLTPQVLDQAAQSDDWLVRLTARSFGGPSHAVNDGGKEWSARLQPAFDAEKVWGLKPCLVSRDGLETLQEGLARLPDKSVAGGLPLVEAVTAHYTAHDIEIEVGAHVLITEDSFEIQG